MMTSSNDNGGRGNKRVGQQQNIIRMTWRLQTLLVLGLMLVLATVGSVTAQAQTEIVPLPTVFPQTDLPQTEAQMIVPVWEPPQSAAVPEWLEPRGMSVVELVGLVPEEHLRDAIVAWSVDGGLLQYQEGRRFSDRVYMQVAVSQRLHVDNTTRLNCPSSRPYSDHWAAPVPPARMRIFEGNREITQRVIYYEVFPAGLWQPSMGANGVRYGKQWIYEPEFTPEGELLVPTNMACIFVLEGRILSEDITATFVFETQSQINVETLGSQTFTFRTYSGPGYAGQFAALQEQLFQLYGVRHDKFVLNIPAATDYVFVKYPPSSATPYVGNSDKEWNMTLPSSGTYRLAHGEPILTIDHQISMGLPLRGQWLDADYDASEYLQPINGVDTLSSPEYFVPQGIQFDPCMVNGGCPPELLHQIGTAQMEMTIYYYHVSRTTDGLARIPLRQVGTEWEPISARIITSATAATSTGVVEPAAGDTSLPPPRHVFIPMIQARLSAANLPPDDPMGCPCGWFTVEGRMVDFIPAPGPVITPTLPLP